MLRDRVASDVRSFIEHQSELMFNELDFQVHLAVWLRNSGSYDDVDVEYFLPNSIADEYDWDSNLYLDIVVRKGDDYCPIELKYPTNRVVKPISRFGVPSDRINGMNNVEIMKHHGAQDIVKYNFWKDVRRVELIKKLFPTVKGGLAVMLTNDSSYVRPCRPTSAVAPFSMSDNNMIGPGMMDWNGTPKVRETHKPFHIDGQYSPRWSEHTIDNIPFFLTIIKI